MTKIKYTGKFITLEGIEGVGKSTAMKFIQKYLQEKNIEFVATREPGGTPLAEEMRKILLKQDQEQLTPYSELLLLFAARAQHLEYVIKPALMRGAWVISDRFTDASFAYQGGGRGIPKFHIAALEKWIQGYLKPDKTILLVAPIKIALERAKHRGKPDRFENEKKYFFVRAQKAYLERVNADKQRFVVINTNRSLKLIHEKIAQVIDGFITK